MSRLNRFFYIGIASLLSWGVLENAVPLSAHADVNMPSDPPSMQTSGQTSMRASGQASMQTSGQPSMQASEQSFVQSSEDLLEDSDTVLSQDFADWYLRGDLGISNAGPLSPRSILTPGFSAPGYRYDSASLGDSLLLGFGLGYRFTSWFRTDVTGEYRFNRTYSAVTSYINGGGCGAVSPTNLRCLDLYRGSVGQTVFLMNGYFDLGTWLHLTPYVGAGVGLAHSSFGSLVDVAVGNGGAGASIGRSTTHFAWALMAGVTYTINSRLQMEMGYRYLDTGRVTSAPIICQDTAGCGREQQSLRMTAHDFRIGFRWTFGVIPSVMSLPSQPVEAAPLVRRF